MRLKQSNHLYSDQDEESRSEFMAVSLNGITKTYHGSVKPAVRDISFRVEQGEVFTLLGPSGSGKTTTIRVIAGLENPEAGSVYFGSRCVVDTSRKLYVPPEKRQIGMVFQSYAVWPHLTVEENVAFALKGRGLNKQEIRRKAEEAIELVGLHGLENRPAPKLSGGQKQRVALARAIVNEPKLLLLDEPFNSLDTHLREQMRFEIKRIQRRLGLAIILVTHDQMEAMTLSDRIAVMDHGQILQQGTPHELYEKPYNPFVRDFLGKSILLKGKFLGANQDSLVNLQIIGNPACQLSGYCQDAKTLSPERTLLIAVRPEDVEIVPCSYPNETKGPLLSGRVQEVLFAGNKIEYRVEVEGQGEFRLCGSRHNPAAENELVSLQIQPHGHSVWLDEASYLQSGT